MFPMLRTGLLLIAHGSREPEANADLLYLVTQVRNRGCYTVVEAAFLELAEPNIIEGGMRCVGQGAKRVLLVPYFLSAGVHVRRDLALARQRLSELHPEVEFRLAEPLGRHPLLLEVVCQRAGESSRSSPTSG
jgi:sirohydrochlorin ferrochelatase